MFAFNLPKIRDVERIKRRRWYFLPEGCSGARIDAFQRVRVSLNDIAFYVGRVVLLVRMAMAPSLVTCSVLIQVQWRTRAHSVVKTRASLIFCPRFLNLYVGVVDH